MLASWEVAQRLESKLEWAKKHIAYLQRFWDTFREDAYPILFKDDPQTGDRFYYLGNVSPIDPRIPLIIGDAVHNIRTSLDHLAHQLVFVGTKGKGPFTGVYFPVGADSEEYKAKLERIEERLANGTAEAINAIEPYEGGRGARLWHIHKLDIIDKHKLLLPIGSLNRYRSLSPSQIASDPLSLPRVAQKYRPRRGFQKIY